MQLLSTYIITSHVGGKSLLCPSGYAPVLSLCIKMQTDQLRIICSFILSHYTASWEDFFVHYTFDPLPTVHDKWMSRRCISGTF